MRVYVSGTWTERGRLRLMAERLRMLGHEVVSTWLDEQDRPEWMPEGKWQERLAAKDVAEVCQADAIILDVDGRSTTGGRYVEWGVACHPRALILRVVVGRLPDTDIFGKLADHHYRDWNVALNSPVFNPQNVPEPVHAAD
jgi:hypothetical protein